MTERIPQMFYRERQAILNEDPHADMASRAPAWADPASWAEICKSWEDENGRFSRLSKSGRENRKKLRVLHSTGSTGFESSISEMVSKIFYNIYLFTY